MRGIGSQPMTKNFLITLDPQSQFAQRVFQTRPFDYIGTLPDPRWEYGREDIGRQALQFTQLGNWLEVLPNS